MIFHHIIKTVFLLISVNPLCSFRFGTIRIARPQGEKVDFILYLLKIFNFYHIFSFISLVWLVNRAGAIVLKFKIG